MNTEELNNFIQNLKNSCATEDSYFSFFSMMKTNTLHTSKQIKMA